MLSRKHRLSKQKDFDRVYKSGKQCAAPHLILKGVRNDADFSRFAIIISKKIAKKAVDRNRVKRQISEIIRQRLAKIKTGFDLVIIVKKDVLDQSSDVLAKELDGLLGKAGLK